MAIFHCYVSSPEGIPTFHRCPPGAPGDHVTAGWPTAAEPPHGAGAGVGAALGAAQGGEAVVEDQKSREDQQQIEVPRDRKIIMVNSGVYGGYSYVVYLQGGPVR